jgi:steroid delta-isomerase-like uncharacterized protein
MASRDTVAIHKRIFEEGFNQHNMSMVDELISPDYVNYDMPAPAPGREGFKQVMGAFFSAFPDMKVTIEGVVAEGDTVASRGVVHGTHRGEFQGIPPTGKQLTVKYMDMWRFVDGKAVENWVQMDMLGLLQQLGAIPHPG